MVWQQGRARAGSCAMSTNSDIRVRGTAAARPASDGERTTRDLLVQDFRSEVEVVRPAYRAEIDKCFGEARGITEGLEDAVEADERCDIDFALDAVIKPDEEAMTPEGS